MSKENPMKAEEQRLRMSMFNPMKNPEVAARISQQKAEPVVINGVEYPSSRIASQMLDKHIETIREWCRRGYDTDGNPCRYANQEQKEYTFQRTCSKAVLVDGEWFPSVKAAATFMGANDSSPLVRALKANKKYKGHTVSYANQQPSEENS